MGGETAADRGPCLTMQSAIAVTALVVAVFGCAGAARWSPVTATLLSCIPISLEVHYNSAGSYGVATGAVMWGAFVLCYLAGSRTSLPRSLPCVVLLVVCWQLAGGVNPFPAVDAFGPLAVGALVRSRTAARSELEAKGRELIREQEQLASESIRYERVRIARELHDIVAHCVSVMVVQAGAGQYLLERDPALAVEALDAISSAAQLAEAEINRLVTLLDGAPVEAAIGPEQSIDELVERARATGLAINYRLIGDRDCLTDIVFEVAYRVVQEAMTNALKHAPGAAIDITATCSASRLGVVVSNAQPVTPGLDFAASDGGHGLAGMRERVSACGGSLVAGPTAGGGWSVEADLPAGGVPISL
jgi:signal transduction histidine kinase